MISLKDILYVKTIAREGSFSQASEKLFISQPALSQAIQKLEERLGLTLILRRRNAPEPHPRGPPVRRLWPARARLAGNA